MITSACGPAAMASATCDGDRPTDGHDAPEGRLGIAVEGPLVGGRQVGVDRAPHGVGVLDDGHGALVAVRPGQLVDQPPGRVGVEDVEVRELLAPVLDHVVPPRVLARDAVAGAVLVGVLAVAQRAGPLEGQVDGGRQDGVGVARLRPRRSAARRTTPRWRRRRRRCGRRRRGPAGGGWRRDRAPFRRSSSRTAP